MSHYCNFWLMFVQVGDFCVGRGSLTVPLTGISCNAVFCKSQNKRKAGTLCTKKLHKLKLKKILKIMTLYLIHRNIKKETDKRHFLYP